MVPNGFEILLNQTKLYQHLFPLSWSVEGVPTLGDPALLASGVALLPSYPAFMWKQTTRYSFHHASFVAEFHISLACKVKQTHAVFFIGTLEPPNWDDFKI